MMSAGFGDDRYDDEPPFGAPDDEPVAEEQLALTDEDERLPWLEADEDYEDEGVDTFRVIAFAAAGLLAILALLGIGWWLTRDSAPDTERVATGGTIEAPDEPYKTRPADAGGQQVAGTGDVSFEVGEGRRTEGVVRDDTSAPAPSIDRNQQAAQEPEAAPEPKPEPEPRPDMSGVGVQVAAYSSRAGAETGWGVLTSRIPALQGVSHRVVQARVDGATVYRLQAVAGSLDSAQQLCRNIRSQGGDCQVKR